MYDWIMSMKTGQNGDIIMHCTMNLLATKNGGNNSCYRIHSDQSEMLYAIIIVILTLKSRTEVGCYK